MSPDAKMLFLDEDENQPVPEQELGPRSSGITQKDSIAQSKQIFMDLAWSHIEPKTFETVANVNEGPRRPM